MTEQLMNNELERIWTEEVVVQFKGVSRYFPGAIEKNNESLCG
jgi:hypothetical protein